MNYQALTKELQISKFVMHYIAYHIILQVQNI